MAAHAWRGPGAEAPAASPGPAVAGLAPPRPKDIPQRLSAGFCFPSGFSLVRPAFWKTAFLGLWRLWSARAFILVIHYVCICSPCIFFALGR